MLWRVLVLLFLSLPINSIAGDFFCVEGGEKKWLSHITKELLHKGEIKTQVKAQNLWIEVEQEKDPEINTHTKVSLKYQFCVDDSQVTEAESVYQWYYNDASIGTQQGISTSLDVGFMQGENAQEGILKACVTPKAQTAGEPTGKMECTSILVDHYHDGIPQSVAYRSWLSQSANHQYNVEQQFEDPYFAATGNNAYAYFDPDKSVFIQGGNTNVTNTLGFYEGVINQYGVSQMYSNKVSLAAKLGNGDLVIWGGNYENAVGFGGIKKVYPAIDSYIVVNDIGELKIIENGSSQLVDPPLNQHDRRILNNNVRAVYHTGSDQDDITPSFAVLTKDWQVITWGSVASGGVLTDEALSGINNYNAIAIYATESAFTALLGNQTLVSWGNPEEGGSTPKEIIHVRQIAATQKAFSALSIYDNQNTVFTWGNDNTQNLDNLNAMTKPEIFANKNSFIIVNNQDSNYITSVWGEIVGAQPNCQNIQIKVKQEITEYSIYSNLKSFILLYPYDSTTLKYCIWGPEANIPSDNGLSNIITQYGLSLVASSKQAFVGKIQGFDNFIASWSSDNSWRDDIEMPFTITNLFGSSSDNSSTDFGCLNITRDYEGNFNDWNTCFEEPSSGPSLVESTFKVDPEMLFICYEGDQCDTAEAIIELRDNNGEPVVDFTGVVNIHLDDPNSTGSEISQTTQTGDNQYKAVITAGNELGEVYLHGFIDGEELNAGGKTITITEDTTLPSTETSLLTANPVSIDIGDVSKISILTKNDNGDDIMLEDCNQLSLQIASGGGFGTLEPSLTLDDQQTNVCYSFFTGVAAGTATFQAYINGQPIIDTADVQISSPVSYNLIWKDLDCDMKASNALNNLMNAGGGDPSNVQQMTSPSLQDNMTFFTHGNYYGSGAQIDMQFIHEDMQNECDDGHDCVAKASDDGVCIYEVYRPDFNNNTWNHGYEYGKQHPSDQHDAGIYIYNSDGQNGTHGHFFGTFSAYEVTDIKSTK